MDIAPSFNDIAGSIDDSTGHSPSRQAVAKRINVAFVNFLKMVLEHTINYRVNLKALEVESNSTCFPRILVQDSTIVKLPSRLFDEFSGVSNGTSTVCNARIQGVYDLVSRSFISFSIDAYSKNDLAACSELSILPGDLNLRDRGYLKYAEVKRQCDNDTFFIYRHMVSLLYRCPETDEEIDLKSLLSEKGQIDMDVTLNNKERTPVRLVAVPVKKEIADVRRMKAKKQTKGHNPSAENLFLMGWSIFITNLPVDNFDFKTLFKLYGLRWRIECIFKTWKSNVSFSVIHNVSSTQLRALLTARLISIVITMHSIYIPCERIIAESSERRLSLLKLMRYIQVRKERILELLEGIAQTTENVLKKLIRYCTYDKRKRLNYAQNEELIFNELLLG